MTPLIQEVAQDSLARVLEDPTRLRDTIAAVFEAPEYLWDREVNLLARIGELWSRLVRTLFELRSDHPAAYYVLLGALVGVLIAILAHFAYIMWRLLHPHTGPHRIHQWIRRARPTFDVSCVGLCLHPSVLRSPRSQRGF